MKKTTDGKLVTQLMKRLQPVHGFDKMEGVIEKLASNQQTAVAVVDDSGCCIGIITQADISRFRQLLKRFQDHDESVIKEMFETDEFGQRRTSNIDFDQVKRHMTSPAVTIMEDQTVREARELFGRHPKIHHLVVVDSSSSPIGIIDATDRDDAVVPKPTTKSRSANS